MIRALKAAAAMKVCPSCLTTSVELERGISEVMRQAKTDGLYLRTDPNYTS